MFDFQTKIDNTAGPAGHLTADEFNVLAQEVENLVRRAGLPLSSSLTDVLQIAQAVAIAGRSAGIFIDGGAVNGIQLTPHAGANTFPLPPDFTGLNGNAVSFRPAFANTGAATIDLGMTAGGLLGPRPLVRPDGSALQAGDVAPGGYITAIYDASINKWRLAQLPLSLDSPVFSGDPQAPTAPVGDDDQSIANTQWVNAAIAAALAPIVAAIGDINTALGNKLDTVTTAPQSVASDVTFNGIVSHP
ncbi:hypothetical protein [Lysobacter sp. GCM10012299]|uniref:hypothetical protein n=1 Tax=Lysobacter sp. GCM10012299 TaxID=3317333 RepID=UPI00360AF2E9